MAYDMHVVGEVHEPDGDYNPLFPSHPGHFRLSHVGMEKMFQIMLRAGILDIEVNHRRWPKWPPEGMDQHRADQILEHYLVDIAITPPPTSEEAEKVRVYLAKRSEIQATLSPKAGLVPAFKFRSNDQWLVSPEECHIIAGGLRSALELDRALILPHHEESGLNSEEEADFVRQWASFNDFAARNDGYRVR